MILFRTETPKRRDIKKIVSKYSDHRDELKLDFKFRCGYCNDTDQWRIVWFEVDHFVPKKFLKKITETDYSNLVYACRSCNNSKRAYWPTGDELIHNKNDEGFIDPCSDEYGEQFARNMDGKIIYKTPLGKWMFMKLKLHKPQHEVIWQIENLDKLIDECEIVLANLENDSVLKDKILELYRKYREYTKLLGCV